MPTTNKTFSIKNGLDVANTIVLDSSRNLSNINSINVGNTDLYGVLNSANSASPCHAPSTPAALKAYHTNSAIVCVSLLESTYSSRAPSCASCGLMEYQTSSLFAFQLFQRSNNVNGAHRISHSREPLKMLQRDLE